ncbi:acetyl-CoA carboxylase biotin carboxyl carrier protein [bacterium]|nr:acetyl-CoA carboxylase biotin carboxyl carrier protein [bacterium]
MDLTEIKKLLKLVEKSDVQEIEIQEDTFYVRILKHGNQIQTVESPAIYSAAAAPPKPAPAPLPESPPAVKPGLSEHLIEICSPMVGTFYSAASPEADPYVQEGDQIKPGKVLCIIEAMKLMNEIEAEITGKIVKVLVDNAQPVEYNQPLFLAEKA